VVLALKRSSSSDHFVESDSCSPDVDALVVAASLVYLGSHVERSADDGEEIAVLSALISVGRRAKIYNFDPFELLVV